MKRGPSSQAALSARPMTMLEKAQCAWGDRLPEWIRRLAELCDREGQKRAGTRIGYSATTVSEVLNNRYKGDIKRVEHAVEGALMGVTVMCPVLGEISRKACFDNQKKPFAPTNSTRARLFHACRKCAHSNLKGGL